MGIYDFRAALCLRFFFFYPFPSPQEEISSPAPWTQNYQNHVSFALPTCIVFLAYEGEVFFLKSVVRVGTRSIPQFRRLLIGATCQDPAQAGDLRIFRTVALPSHRLKKKPREEQPRDLLLLPPLRRGCSSRRRRSAALGSRPSSSATSSSASSRRAMQSRERSERSELRVPPDHPTVPSFLRWIPAVGSRFWCVPCWFGPPPHSPFCFAQLTNFLPLEMSFLLIGWCLEGKPKGAPCWESSLDRFEAKPKPNTCNRFRDSYKARRSPLSCAVSFKTRCGRGSKPLGSYFGAGEFTTQFRTYFSGDWDVHWGYDLAFDPWPCREIFESLW